MPLIEGRKNYGGTVEQFKVEPKEIKDNPFKIIGSDWMLITAGDMNSFNTMTAAWGGLGVLWHKNVCYTYIRPTRYTYEFMEKNDNFTVSFFEESYRKTLNFCGTNSGRDVDKVKETGLTPVEDPSGSIYFEEARLVLVCKKLYFQDLDRNNFLDPGIEKHYPEKDYHRLYVGEILTSYVK